MIAYQNSFITISYAPDTDILSVNWPDFAPETILETKEALNKIIEVLNSYDVKNLLIDAGKTKVSLSYADYKEIIKAFSLNLRKTRIQKFARIISQDPEREENVKSVRQESTNTFQYRDFKITAEAINWLTEKAG